MQPEKILKSDSLDILFEHRNKLYGAYELRKKYNKRLLLALAMGLLVISLPIIYISFKKLDIIKTQPEFTTDIYIMPPVSFIPKQKVPKKVAVQKPLIKKEKAGAKNNSGLVKIVKENFISKEEMESSVSLNNMPGMSGEDITDPPMAGNGNEFSEEVEVTPLAPEPDPNIALPVAEQMPAYPGGLKALRKFLERNLESPRTLEEGEKINVQVKFIVGYDGNLKSFELVKDGGSIFNKEVIRVLKLMPRWIPGKNAGKNVAVYFSLPVSFIAPE